MKFKIKRAKTHVAAGAVVEPVDVRVYLGRYLQYRMTTIRDRQYKSNSSLAQHELTMSLSNKSAGR